MLDFPNSPSEGDVHTEKGQSWQFRNGAWVVTGGINVSEFHDPTGVASWRIIGATLECWGREQTNTTNSRTVTFPKTFARMPEVHGQVDSAGGRWCNVSQITTTGVILRAQGGSAHTNENIMWRAIGEWDGIS